MTTRTEPVYRVQKRVRRECELCGEPATKRLSFLLPHYRTNPASSAYGRDDCSWCSDADRYACDGCVDKVEREGVDGMRWCSTFSRPACEHQMFKWQEDKDATRAMNAHDDLVAACQAAVADLECFAADDTVRPTPDSSTILGLKAALAKAEKN